MSDSGHITTAQIARAIDELIAENVRLKRDLEARDHVAGDNSKKLTRREVEKIRSLKRSGFSQKSIADIFDVNPATVSRIIRGQYHK